MRKKIEEICKNWEIDPEDHRDDFEWLMADPGGPFGTETGLIRLTRELGIREPGGEPVRIRREQVNGVTVLYEDHPGEDLMLRWTGRVSINSADVRW